MSVAKNLRSINTILSFKTSPADLFVFNSIFFCYLKLDMLTQFPASNNEKYTAQIRVIFSTENLPHYY